MPFVIHIFFAAVVVLPVIRVSGLTITRQSSCPQSSNLGPSDLGFTCGVSVSVIGAALDGKTALYRQFRRGPSREPTRVPSFLSGTDSPAQIEGFEIR